jgi:hypothetical protein
VLEPSGEWVQAPFLVLETVLVLVLVLELAAEWVQVRVPVLAFQVRDLELVQVRDWEFGVRGYQSWELLLNSLTLLR